MKRFFQALSFYLSLPFIFGFSLIPLPILYFFSDIIFFPLLYYVVGYRKEVVRDNLSKSYPGKDTKAIEKRFYRFLSDLMIETIKSFTISRKEVLRRVKTDDSVFELLNSYYDKNQSILLSLGHYGNYEWASLYFCINSKFFNLMPFKKFSNPYFHKLFTKTRGRFGGYFFSTTLTAKVVSENANDVYALSLINDQSVHNKNGFWTQFLNRETSFYKGTEVLAKEYNLPVIFVTMNCVKRGHYTMDLEKITDNPREEAEGFILNKHAQLLEREINQDPAYWLWSHRRWKTNKPKDKEHGKIY